MSRRLTHLSNKYLFTIWTVILTVGVVLALVGLQANSNKDSDRSIQADAAQAVAFCHSVANNNQAVRDILSILSVDTKITDDMTPSQKESIRIANERRKGYRLIAEDLFPVEKCDDGYEAKSRQDELLPIIQTTPGTTTTSSTVPGG